jgi:apolipoprotein N-acyltransferase
MVIITNDGWWQNTPGHKQHWLYARLRAIENRRWVARSANTGISGFIDPMGNEIAPQAYGKTACIRVSVPVQSNQPSFFARTGDILSKWIGAFYIGLWIWTLVIRRRLQNS